MVADYAKINNSVIALLNYEVDSNLTLVRSRSVTSEVDQVDIRNLY